MGDGKSLGLHVGHHGRLLLHENPGLVHDGAKHFGRCIANGMFRVEYIQEGLILYCHAAANAWSRGGVGETWLVQAKPLTALRMWWIAHPCPVMCMHIWSRNGLSMGPLSFNHVKAKYRTEHIFCCIALLLCHSLQPILTASPQNNAQQSADVVLFKDLRLHSVSQWIQRRGGMFLPPLPLT